MQGSQETVSVSEMWFATLAVRLCLGYASVPRLLVQLRVSLNQLHPDLATQV